MILLVFLLYFSIPTLIVAAIQYLFCQCKYMIIKFVPTIAAFCFMVWFAAVQSQLPEEPVGCPTGAGITTFFTGGIFMTLLIGLAIGWLMYVSRMEDGEQEKKGEE